MWEFGSIPFDDANGRFKIRQGGFRGFEMSFEDFFGFFDFVRVCGGILVNSNVYGFCECAMIVVVDCWYWVYFVYMDDNASV